MRVNVHGRRRVEVEDMHVIKFPLQIRLSEISKDLGAYRCGAHQKGQLNHRRHREASGSPTRDPPCEVGNARLRTVILLRRLAKRSAREHRDLHPTIGTLLDLLHPRYDDVGMVVMRGGRKVGELDLLGCGDMHAPCCQNSEESEPKASQAPEDLRSE